MAVGMTAMMSAWSFEKVALRGTFAVVLADAGDAAIVDCTTRSKTAVADVVPFAIVVDLRGLDVGGAAAVLVVVMSWTSGAAVGVAAPTLCTTHAPKTLTRKRASIPLETIWAQKQMDEIGDGEKRGRRADALGGVGAATRNQKDKNAQKCTKTTNNITITITPCLPPHTFRLSPIHTCPKKRQGIRKKRVGA